MSGVAQLANTEALATPTLRSPSLLRARPSVADVVDLTALASERAIAELQAKLERVEGENAALRGEVAERDAQSAEAAEASKAAMQAQATTIESLTATNADLRGELTAAKSIITNLTAECDEAKIKFTRLHFAVAQLKQHCYWSPPLPQMVLEYTLYGDKKIFG